MGPPSGNEAHLFDGLAAAAKGNGVALMAIGLDANCFAEAQGLRDRHASPEHGSDSRDRRGSPWKERRGTPAERLRPEQLQGLRKQPGLILAAAWVGASVVGCCAGSMVRAEGSSAIRRLQGGLVVERAYPVAMDLSRITHNPEQCGGKPCIRGMRIRVRDIFELYAAGMSSEAILADYPDLELEDLRAALDYAARALDHPVLVG
jgi:uncharacterized protein (DUF433 family)